MRLAGPPAKPVADCRPNRAPWGFTLIELLITLAVVGILATVAYPTYREHVFRARRSEAFSALSAVVQAQERWRAGHSRYAPSLEALGLQAYSSPGQHYQIELQNDDTRGNSHFMAIARPSGVQRADTRCAQMRMGIQGIQLLRTASDSQGSDTSRQCWPS